MNFNENDVWMEKTKPLDFKFSKLAKVVLNLAFDTKDQVLSYLSFYALNL